MPAFAGFDTDIYPGDAAMSWLKDNTNLAWCGYYLGHAPSHPDTSWMGNRSSLMAAGWGIAPVYVGEQVTGKGSLNPSGPKGTQDGNDAVAKLNAEGFAPGSCVYLDLENGRPFPLPLQAYTVSWCAAVAAGGFQPGVYCSYQLALQVHGLVAQALIWAFHVKTLTPTPYPSPYPFPSPVGCGYGGAYAWQHVQNAILTVPPAHGGTLHVDLDSALVQDPGAPSAS
jgi:hypothetical protein